MVLLAADQAASHSFAFHVGDLVPNLRGDGAVELTAVGDGHGLGAGPIMAVISAPVLYDGAMVGAPLDALVVSLYRPGTGDVPPPSLSAAALASLAPGEIVVTYAVNPGWLASPERVFPVTIDPTICVQVGNSGCVGAGNQFDHYVASGIPTTYPVPDLWIRVGYTDAGDGFANMRGLVYFDDVALPDTAHVTAATITLREDDNRDASTSPDLYAQLITKGWGSTSSWNAMSGAVNATYDSPTVAPCNAGATDCDLVIDVEKIARAWLTRRSQDWKPNIGFQVRQQTESSAEKEIRFYRFTNATTSNRPKLTITYELLKPDISFALELGSTYSPSTMVAGQATLLPVSFKNNNSSTTWNKTVDGGGWKYQFGYRWFDAKGNLAGSGAEDLGADVAAGTSSGVFALDVSPPATPGQYTLRIDLVHDDNGLDLFASDWADPNLYYARKKDVLSADVTRWTGSSLVERADFPIAVIRGGGTNAGELRTVELGDGSTLGIDLATRNLHYEGAGGIGFEDLLPVDVGYGYDSKHAADCATFYSPTLRTTDGDKACGWYTNWDERLSPGTAPGSYIYQGPSGNRHFVDTDGNGQLSSNAPVLLERVRFTAFDEVKPTGHAATVVDPSSFNAWSGTYILEAPSNAHKGGPIGPVDLNAHGILRFAARTSVVASAGLALKIKNLTTGVERWFVYTLGPDWTTTYDQAALGGRFQNAWQNYGADLFAAISSDPDFGSAYDSYQVTHFQIQSSSGSNGGSTYVDAVRFEARQTTWIADTEPGWSANDANGALTTDTPPIGITNSQAVEVKQTTYSAAPTCASACPPTSGGLYRQPFVSWWWKKIGGTSVAIEMELKDLRTNATGKITYYSGKVPPPGAINPLQVSDTMPTVWTQVARNVAEDGRQVLGFYNDVPAGSGPGTPPAQGPVGDEVAWIGYRLWAPDGNFARFDAMSYGSVPNIAVETLQRPWSEGDTAFVYDFVATYPNGDRHFFNGDGLLTRVEDQDANRIAVVWTTSASVEGQASYTLMTIRGPKDGTTSGANPTSARSAGPPGSTRWPSTRSSGRSARPAAGRSSSGSTATPMSSRSSPPARRRTAPPRRPAVSGSTTPRQGSTGSTS